VYKWNHVAGYLDNGLEEGAIEHVYFKSFEEVDLIGADLQHFLAVYGRKSWWKTVSDNVDEWSQQHLTIAFTLTSN
jgi:hypothetical protein